MNFCTFILLYFICTIILFIILFLIYKFIIKKYLADKLTFHNEFFDSINTKSIMDINFDTSDKDSVDFVDTINIIDDRTDTLPPYVDSTIPPNFF